MPRTLIVAACLANVQCSSSAHPDTAGDAAGGNEQPPIDAAIDATRAPGDAASAIDSGPNDDASPGDGGAPKGAWGQPCTVGNDTTCATGLFCLQGPSGGTTGFCTKTCPPTSSAQCSGTPAGTAAFCVVTDVDNQGDKGCAFACRVGSQTWPCPGALTCETADDPPDSGQRVCLP